MRCWALLAFCAVSAGAGCDRSRAAQIIDDAQAEAPLVGTWDANLSLTHPYQLGSGQPAARRICGTIGFVGNRGAGGSATRGAPDVGVYDLDLARLGLDWRGDDSFPTALVPQPAQGAVHLDKSGRDSDSVTIVLNPGSSERIVLLGRYEAKGIDGAWQAQSARGTATGSFSLRPHGALSPGSRC